MLKTNIISSFIITILVGIANLPGWSQYPEVPPELEQQGEEIEREAQEQSDKAWEEAWPAIQQEIKEGKPYIPYAARPSDLPQASIPAFPGAEGGGMYAYGGRGGKVITVTSLADSGPGTFREAVETGGARIVVFNVSGIIRLETPVSIRAPYITIAGQTAPGDGICIAGESVWINTHDVVIRHMRFRRGETFVGRRDDALGGEGIGNIIIDHCSVSWGLDENLSLYRNMYINKDGEREKLPVVNVTIQNTISSEALDTYNHAFGSTLGGLNSTFARNLWASNISRIPSVGMYGDFSLVNNVMFNWWNRTVDGGDHRSRYNIINNYYKPGPITPKDKPIAYRFLKPEGHRGVHDSLILGLAYVHGNIAEGYPGVSQNNWDGGVQLDEKAGAGKYEPYIKSKKPFQMAPVTIMTAKDAYHYVLNNVGATQPRRDAVDQRIIEQVRTGEIQYAENAETGVGSEYIRRRLPEDSYKKGIITHVSQVGGYPEYKGEPYTDTDKDGMPDWYEEKYSDLGLDANDPSDANGDINGDGYTNIEMYINNINPYTSIPWGNLLYNYDTLSELPSALCEEE